MDVSLDSVERTFRSAVAGEAQQNEDGTDRQSLIAECHVGQPVELRRESDNPYDRWAIAIINSVGQKLGYIPAGDARLALDIDRGIRVRATIAAITGGPNVLQRLIGAKGKYYGLVLQVSVMSTNPELVDPWLRADGKIWSLVHRAHSDEKSNPELAVAQYREAITQIQALDALGATAAAWRTCSYPIQRFSLGLDRLGNKADALAEIRRWESYPDPVGIPNSDRDGVMKRKDRLEKAAAKA